MLFTTFFSAMQNVNFAFIILFFSTMQQKTPIMKL